jgi:PAS domain S-box-containing protein
VLETSGVPVLDEHGRFRGYRGIDRDITERQRERQALEDSEALFRQMAETIREVFFVRDAVADRMIYVSPSYEQMWGRPRAELFTDPTAFVRGVHPDDREAVVQAMAAMRRGEAYFNQEYRVVQPGGRVLWVWARAFPVRNAAGDVYRVTGLIEDITARKLEEEQRLDHARRQREALVREVHHRIKNNLQGVVGLLRQHAARQPSAAPLLDTAITQVNAVAIVHGLHGRSRDEQLLLCDMVHAIGDAVAGLHGVRVEMAFVPHMPLGIAVLPAEAVPLALIVNEMVINAVKHGGEQVRLDLRQERGVIVVEARNPGHLADEVDIATARGLGTGLSLVRALLPLQGAIFVLVNDGPDVVAQLRLGAPLVSGYEGLPDAVCQAATG